MYMIEDAHEAIIEKEVFEAVQKKKRWSTSVSEIDFFIRARFIFSLGYKRNSSAFSKMFSKDIL